ncbi:MAG: hypothetical protein OHK0023_08880 [Anaerolineae bacterium]
MTEPYGTLHTDQVPVESLKFDEAGLITCVVQDTHTHQVLMVAWANQEAIKATQRTGQAHFWSRSRGELWHKGATSGHVMRVERILVDCDADTLILLVEPAGPACHTGQISCFFRDLADSPPQNELGSA